VNSGSAARLRMWLWASMIIGPPSLWCTRWRPGLAGAEDDDIRLEVQREASGNVPAAGPACAVRSHESAGPVRITRRQLPTTCGEPIAFSDMLSLNYAM
jgi:hypothetical protein